LVKQRNSKGGCLLYIGAGRCSGLNEFIKSKAKTIVLVDANPAVCNYLKYETRNAPHIAVVQAAITSTARTANFKIFNFEEMSSLLKPADLLEIYPGLELDKASAITTVGFSELVKTHVPKGASFDLILDVSGGEGEIVSEVLAGPYFKKVQNFKIICSARELYRGAIPASKIEKLFNSIGISTTLIGNDADDFIALSGKIDAALLEKLELEKKIQALSSEKKRTSKTLAQLKSENIDLTEKLSSVSTALSKAKEDLNKADKELSKIKIELVKPKEELSKTKEALVKAEEDLSKAKEALSAAKQDTKNGQIKSDELSEKLATSEKSLEEIRKDLNSTQKERSVATAELAKLKSAIKEWENKYSDLLAQQEKFSERDKYLTSRIADLEKELIISKSFDQDAMTSLKSSMQATYQSIIDELNHQISTLTKISHNKSGQIDKLFIELENVDSHSEMAKSLKTELQDAKDVIFKLKSKIAEREATLKWHRSQAQSQSSSSKSDQNFEKGKNQTDKAKLSSTAVTDSKVVLVGSSPRSGGTWVFNVIRGIFETLQLPYSSGWHEEFAPSDNDKYHLIKVHGLDDYTGSIWKTITNHRPLEERIASLIRMGWVEETDEDIRSALKFQASLYQGWRERTDHEVNFDYIEKDPRKIIRDISKVLELTLSKAQEDHVLGFVNGLVPPDKPPHDPVTLLHPRHRVNDKVLSQERISRVQSVMKAQL